MRIAFQIDQGDGPQTVVVGPAAMIGWEVEHGRSVVELADTITLAAMTELVWRQLQLEGYGESLDVFRAQLLDIDPARSPDPT